MGKESELIPRVMSPGYLSESMEKKRRGREWAIVMGPNPMFKFNLAT